MFALRSGASEANEAGGAPTIEFPGGRSGSGKRRPDRPAATPPDSRKSDAAPSPDRADFRRARDELYSRLKEALATRHFEDELQYELARWVELLETPGDALKKVRRPADEIFAQILREAEIALTSLMSDKPDLLFARTLRLRAEIRVLAHDGWPTRQLVRLTDGNPALTVGFGVLIAMAVGLGTHLLWPAIEPLAYVEQLVALDLEGTPTVVGAAFLGGVVSILSRLQAFSRLRDFDPVFLFLNALFKPFVGVIFALFGYAFWKSGLLPLDPGVLSEVLSAYQLWVIGFLAGFSERFANDLISRGESLVAPKKV